ncbi:MAG: Plug domain-containing protein [Bacteroidales bacterium]|nr:Plug domain-containing protein [Bacteroidales bacterium]
MLYKNGLLNISLENKATELQEVEIIAESRQNVTSSQMGLNKLDSKIINEIPSTFGEKDVIKSALLLPGVKTVGEASGGFNVRGGSADQNLILFNGATIYNSSHLFGFFSAFNPDAVEGLDLYKGSIPAEYGGRVSSVMNIESKEASNQHFKGEGSIGLLTSRLTLEIPVIKNHVSVLAGGRATYSDWLLQKIDVPEVKTVRANFQTLTLVFLINLLMVPT